MLMKISELKRVNELVVTKEGRSRDFSQKYWAKQDWLWQITAEPWKILEEWKKRKKISSEGTQNREVNYSGRRKRKGGESSLRKK